jgi:hypothetical protein
VTDEGCIGDRAWIDGIPDGFQQSIENGLPNATFLLRSAATGALIQVVVSNVFGTYWFSGVPPGEYYIEAIPPVGFGFTSNDVGINDALDSDFDSETAVTDVFNFGGGTLSTIDAGFVSSISM